MRTLELKDNELYLDGVRLSYITNFTIEYDASNNVYPQNYCHLNVKGIVVEDGNPVKDGYGYFAIYEIDEDVELAPMKTLYEFINNREVGE